MTLARLRWPVAGVALLAASLALFWPGVAMYDSVVQYDQVLAGRFDDWHPPAMARLWALFGDHGGAPLFVLQMAAYWAGFALIAAALARVGRRRAALAVLAIGVWPPFLGWQAAVLKDAQMLGAMLAAVGLVGWWRLRGRAVPRLAAAAIVVLLTYATLVRANALFAVLPLGVALLERPRDLRWRGAALIVATLAVLAAMPLVNHAVLRATPSGVERTQALYDLAGIAVRTGDSVATGIAPDDIAALRVHRCVKPFFWDPLGDDDHCAAYVAAIHRAVPASLYVRLAGAIVLHPVAYAAHRLAHWNSTERWLTPARLMGAGPPDHSEANAIGLGGPGWAAVRWQRLAAILTETPPGWPIVWTVMAALLLPVALRRDDPAARLTRGLLASAMLLEASFLVLSIASDWRYHLWPMVATAIGAVLLAPARWWRSRVVLGVLGIVCVTGIATRALLPTPPQGYQAMVAG